MQSLFHKFFILLIAFLIISCAPNNERTIHNYGINNENNLQKSAFIDLSKYDSYDDLLIRVEQIACNDSIPAIRIINKTSEKRIILANICMEGVACILRKRRNELRLEDEKIHMMDTIGIDSLGQYLSKHYNNNGKSPMFSESPQKAFISISYKDLPINGLELLLDKITEASEEQQISSPLIIVFDEIIPPFPSDVKSR